jgi:hypothetical protein
VGARAPRHSGAPIIGQDAPVARHPATGSINHTPSLADFTPTMPAQKFSVDIARNGHPPSCFLLLQSVPYSRRSNKASGNRAEVLAAKMAAFASHRWHRASVDDKFRSCNRRSARRRQKSDEIGDLVGLCRANAWNAPTRRHQCFTTNALKPALSRPFFASPIAASVSTQPGETLTTRIPLG